MTDAGSEFVTIAEAARRLGIQERQARRYADKLPDIDRTEDRTATGRPRTLVRLSSFSTLVEARRLSGHRPDIGPAVGPDIDRTDGAALVNDGAAIAPLLHRVIAEQSARIEDMKEQLERMNAALQLAQENLSREQTLRMLSAPAELTAHEPDSDHAQNQPPNAPEAPSAVTEPAPLLSPTGYSGPDTARVSSGEPQERARWWRRLFGLRG